jgi:hypothetical protein
MPSILTAIAMTCLAIGILWGGYLWSRIDEGGEHGDVPEEFLVGLGRGLDLDQYTKRDFFGEELQVLSGSFGDLSVELEVSSGRWRPYLRLVLEFDRSLARNVSVFSEDRSGVVSYVQRVRELEIGEEKFDDRFLLYAPKPDDVRKLLPDATRYQMIRLDERVGEVRMTDNSLFVLHQAALHRDQIRSILKKTIDLGERLYRTAEKLGRRRPETAASRYEQATIDQAVRSETAGGESRGSS